MYAELIRSIDIRPGDPARLMLDPSSFLLAGVIAGHADGAADPSYEEVEAGPAI